MSEWKLLNQIMQIASPCKSFTTLILVILILILNPHKAFEITFGVKSFDYLLLDNQVAVWNRHSDDTFYLIRNVNGTLSKISINSKHSANHFCWIPFVPNKSDDDLDKLPSETDAPM